MEDKNKQKPKLTVKKINKAFGLAIFVLVFIFTFLWTLEPTIHAHPGILWSVAAGVVGLTGIAWLVTALVVKSKIDKADENKQKIKQALSKLKKEEEQKKYTDESNS